MNSQNGYTTLPHRLTGALPRLRKWTIPGTGRHLVMRDGSAGFVLAHLALWFHSKVERLDHGVWDEWGYAARPVRGGTKPSNHASGTAIDLNATRHPLGVATLETFTPEQAARIRRRLRLTFLGCIRWGGDYTKRPDAMHFELIRGLRAVELLAKALAKTPRGRRILAANPGALEAIRA